MPPIVRLDKISSLRVTGPTYVVLAVVTKIFSWSEFGKLTDHPIPLQNNNVCIFLPDHPLSSFHRDWDAGSIADRDEIDKRMGPLFWGDEVGHVEDVIHRDFQARQLFEFWDHKFWIEFGAITRFVAPMTS